MKKLFAVTFVSLVTLLAVSTNPAYSHCEIPCGIYGDSLRIALLKEHISTIEKSMIQVKELSSKDNINYNQVVRWVSNKEEHAKEIQAIVSQYFLHQRVKPVSPSDEKGYNRYINQLTSLHELLIYAMKAKQTTDAKYIDLMKTSLHNFEHAYFDKP